MRLGLVHSSTRAGRIGPGEGARLEAGRAEAGEEGCKVLGNSLLLDFSPEVFAKSPRQA